ncbi:Hypothetical protein PHPALM_18343 [Phytophthora palmivora]|uniref:Uncharacterized protein n=1 Tax=Phytophthora palmivora TaxID=4796 RepID=A0A2P4XJZ2_9STRA|nr:Hypothetical protein PHPALM_18343 [Phytophthora palmivora]
MSSVENLGVGLIQNGIENFRSFVQLKSNPAWKRLVQPGGIDEYEVEAEPTSNFQNVETIRNMRFEHEIQIDGPQNLFEQPDESTATSLCPEFKHLFEHSACSSFFAYLPLYFWRQVLYQTNEYAVAKNLNGKGEFSNYWEAQPEDVIFGGCTTALDEIMSLHRFKLLRRCLSVSARPSALHIGAAA